MSHEIGMPVPPKSTTRAIKGFDGIGGRNVPKRLSSIQRLFGFAHCSPESGAIRARSTQNRAGNHVDRDGSGGVVFALGTQP
jgi:hypothetical protein